MADAAIFQIEDGVFALAVVDKTEVGYLDSWNAPGGATVDNATEADYHPSSTTWKCQVTSATLTPSADTTTTDVPATFCAPGKTIPTPGETSYALDASFLQDPQIVAGLSRFLFEFDTQEAYFLFGMDGPNPPKAIGRVRVQSGAIGGAARSTLTADVSLPCSRKPQILFGNTTASEAVPPNTPVTPIQATGANEVVGLVGTWTPAGAVAPATLVACNAAVVNVVPTTAWSTDSFMTLGDASTAHWDGAAWVIGTAP
jgi:hypothetical protein